MRYRCCIIVLLAVASHTPATDREGLPPIVKAPTLKKLDVAKTTILKPCDGVIACADLDCLVIRRGKKLFQLSLVEPFEEKFLGEDDAFAEGRLLKAVGAGERLFVVLNKVPAGNSWEIGHPILYDVSRKQIVSLVPAEVKLVKRGGFNPTDFDVAPQRGGMVVRMSYGGPTGSSPRPPYNDPFYCWVNLRDGTVLHLPHKFEPNYTEGSGRIMFSGRFAWDNETGTQVAEVPDFRKTPCYYYSWGYRGTARGLILRAGPGDFDHIVGVATNGKTYDVPFPKGLQYANEVHAAKDCAALYIRQADGQYEEALWLAPLDGKSPPRRLCRDRHILMDFAVLDGGHCLFVSHHGRDRERTRNEVFLYNYAKNEMFELLDGAGGLPPLTKAEKKDYYHDSLTVRLTVGLGKSQRDNWALASLSHQRNDFRSFPIGPPPTEPALPARKWERHMLISSQGAHYEIAVPVAHNQEAFLHNQGTIVLKTQAPGQFRDRRDGPFDLTLYRLKLP